MKMQSTSKVDSFENWRVSKTDLYKSFIWPQLNYSFSDACIISIIFEQKPGINVSRHPKLIDIIERAKIPYFVINLTDRESKYFISPSDLSQKLDLTLKYNHVDLSGVTSYWEFRLKTVPTNCLSADIDSLEISNNLTLVTVEAAQLFDTSSKENAMRHIFRTFKWRNNQVNPKQYLAQQEFTLRVGGESYILFHKIKDNNVLDDKSPCFLLKNDRSFYDMLCFIKENCKRDDENKFIHRFQSHLRNELMYKENIYQAYDFIKSI